MAEFNIVTTEKPDDIRTEASESSAAADDSPQTSHGEPQPIPEAPNSEVEQGEVTPSTPPPVLTTSGRKRPPYKYDPNKVTLRFVFANRDGLAVTIECRPADTVGDVKHALLSAWPEGKHRQLHSTLDFVWKVAHTSLTNPSVFYHLQIYPTAQVASG